ncbi:MAG: type III pantothenate kinase [Pseudomonadota bacterium]
MPNPHRLLIDIGNSTIDYLRCSDGKRFTYAHHDQALDEILSQHVHEEIVFCSVVRHLSDRLVALCETQSRTYLHINSYHKIGFGMQVDHPDQVGIDRLVSLKGARQKYKGNLLVIDAGTATTFDLLDKDDNFLGGAITAGLGMMRDMLYEKTDALPYVALEKPATPIGINTDMAMKSGLYWGYIGLLHMMIRKYKHIFARDLTVLASGGVMSLLRDELKEDIDGYDDMLIFEGLNYLSCKNIL